MDCESANVGVGLCCVGIGDKVRPHHVGEQMEIFQI